MKKYFASVFVVLFTMPALACPYKMIWADQYVKYGACVDGLKIEQLRPDSYRVTFANYFPGTKLPIDRFSFYLNGSKDTLEKQFVTLHEILSQHKVGNLVFVYGKGFQLQQKEAHYFTQHALELIESINANLK